MPSSTSSFSLRRVLWGTVACIAVLACWQVLIWCHGVTPSTGIHQWEDNVIRVERFADKAQRDRPVVLVGSSLMARLDAAKIGSSVV
ncbi:MAG: hypothetical protein JWO89_1308, partial [Verrucomicrobiaceae bacterium]|nr:hypothetical protein [Verrucomicrobiaceae bacterium]